MGPDGHDDAMIGWITDVGDEGNLRKHGTAQITGGKNAVGAHRIILLVQVLALNAGEASAASRALGGQRCLAWQGESCEPHKGDSLPA